LKMGPDCYKDDRRFPSGAWCKVGDWVVFRAYSGTRMKMYGQEFRLINDDTVEAVVEDPTGVVRA
jgi:co-chaperonin GroES (HSP10)